MSVAFLFSFGLHFFLHKCHIISVTLSSLVYIRLYIVGEYTVFCRKIKAEVEINIYNASLSTNEYSFIFMCHFKLFFSFFSVILFLLLLLLFADFLFDFFACCFSFKQQKEMYNSLYLSFRFLFSVIFSGRTNHTQKRSQQILFFVSFFKLLFIAVSIQQIFVIFF